MAHEDEEAWGVKSGNQLASVQNGWEKDLPASLVKRWRERWPGYDSPADLFPAGNRNINQASIHVEMIPWVPNELGVPQPENGLLFTPEQHSSLAILAIDVAVRNGWSDQHGRWGHQWWRTPALAGHEDFGPIDRHNKFGSWDPGWLRAKPYFDWDAVTEEIAIRELAAWSKRVRAKYIPLHNQKYPMGAIPMGDTPLEP